MLRFLAKALLTLATLIILATGFAWVYFLPATPDDFYNWPLENNLKPGTLLKQEVFTRNLPVGTKGWRILYQTTRKSGAPAIANAIVVVSANAQQPSPVIAWAHGTTGVAQGCAPSLFENPFPNIPAFPAIFNEGWAYVATDYVGQGTSGGHAYLIGEDAGQNVLDSIRAARQIKDIQLDPRTQIWGHSQGGHSALWAGQLAVTYAPELSIWGIAALAPASDLEGLMREGKSLTFGKIVSAYVIDSYSSFYDDLKREDIASGWSNFLANDISRRCVGGFETLFSAIMTKLAPADGLFMPDALTGPFGARLKQNTPTLPIAAPLFLAQGLSDDLVFPSVQDAYVKSRCPINPSLDYRRYEGRDHISLVANDSPLTNDLLSWSRARFAGEAISSSCIPPS
jgi:acetyl esterase/lipase